MAQRIKVDNVHADMLEETLLYITVKSVVLIYLMSRRHELHCVYTVLIFATSMAADDDISLKALPVSMTRRLKRFALMQTTRVVQILVRRHHKRSIPGNV